jgi:hypothetical protein
MPLHCTLWTEVGDGGLGCNALLSGHYMVQWSGQYGRRLCGTGPPCEGHSGNQNAAHARSFVMLINMQLKFHPFCFNGCIGWLNYYQWGVWECMQSRAFPNKYSLEVELKGCLFWEHPAIRVRTGCFLM